MSEIIIDGNKKLDGSVKIGGSKNAALPIIAASVLCDGVCEIYNCPKISDCLVAIKILENLNIKCSFSGNTLIVDGKSAKGYTVPECLMRQMRSSSIFLGAILARMGKAVISCPGGCELGPRPIDLHIKGLEKLGATAKESSGYIRFSAQGGLVGNKINLSFPSVGATENLMIAATTAKGTTIIKNAAKEPEIICLADFLNFAGAKIEGAGTDTVRIEGVKKLSSSRITVIPDRIVASTYISAVCSATGDICLNDVDVTHLDAVLSVFGEAGCTFYKDNNSLRVKCDKRPNGISIVRALPYPAFPTDSGPLLISSLIKSIGTTVFTENIFENRYRYIDELIRLGADIKTMGKTAIITGVEETHGASCVCTDLRGGGALVVAGLGATGITKISKTSYIKRGYEDIVSDLKYLGADIKEVENKNGK